MMGMDIYCRIDNDSKNCIKELKRLICWANVAEPKPTNNKKNVSVCSSFVSHGGKGSY